MVLKYNAVVLIETQEDLNQFAELEEVPEDALHIDEDYVAFRDDLGAVQLIPKSKLEAGHWSSQIKPTLFRKWYNKNREK